MPNHLLGHVRAHWHPIIIFSCCFWVFLGGVPLSTALPVTYRAKQPPKKNIRLEWKQVEGASVYVVTINLSASNIRVRPVMATETPRGAKPFGELVAETSAIAAINGTFFHPTSYFPTGDIVIDGELKTLGRTKTALAITQTGEAKIVSIDPGHHHGQYRYLLSAGPRLLTDGKISLNPRQEGIHDPAVLGIRNRSAVGITKNNKLLFVVVPHGIQLHTLAHIMKTLGTTEAMNLDGGGSSALYFEGETIRNAKYLLPNILVVEQITEDPAWLWANNTLPDWMFTPQPPAAHLFADSQP